MSSSVSGFFQKCQNFLSFKNGHQYEVNESEDYEDNDVNGSSSFFKGLNDYKKVATSDDLVTATANHQ